ncbi:unnamed protein product [Tenebrio molitor]|nr:unnamed protein product [Tenebrio molitor]
MSQSKSRVSFVTAQIISTIWYKVQSCSTLLYLLIGTSKFDWKLLVWNHSLELGLKRTQFDCLV